MSRKASRRTSRRCVATGVAGLSIEDATGDQRQAALRSRSSRSSASRRRARRSTPAAPDVLLTGRAECFLVGHPDPLRGIDPPARGLCGGRRRRALCARPAHARRHPGDRRRRSRRSRSTCSCRTEFGLTVDDIAALGVRRISVGSALARAAWAGFIRRREADRRGGQLRRLRRHGRLRRAQRLLPRGPRRSSASMTRPRRELDAAAARPERRAASKAAMCGSSRSIPRATATTLRAGRPGAETRCCAICSRRPSRGPRRFRALARQGRRHATTRCSSPSSTGDRARRAVGCR